MSPVRQLARKKKEFQSTTAQGEEKDERESFIRPKRASTKARTYSYWGKKYVVSEG